MGNILFVAVSLVLSLLVPIIIIKTRQHFWKRMAKVFVCVQALIVQIVVGFGFLMYCAVAQDYTAAYNGIYSFSVWILMLVPYFLVFKAKYGGTAYWEYGPPQTVWAVVEPDGSWVCPRCGIKNLRLHNCLECGSIPYVANPEAQPQEPLSDPQAPEAAQTPPAPHAMVEGPAPVPPASVPPQVPAQSAPPPAEDSLLNRPDPKTDVAVNASGAAFYCRFCGKPLDGQYVDVYCPYCGKRLNNTAKDGDTR